MDNYVTCSTTTKSTGQRESTAVPGSRGGGLSRTSLVNLQHGNAFSNRKSGWKRMGNECQLGKNSDASNNCCYLIVKKVQKLSEFLIKELRDLDPL